MIFLMIVLCFPLLSLINFMPFLDQFSRSSCFIKYGNMLCKCSSFPSLVVFFSCFAFNIVRIIFLHIIGSSIAYIYISINLFYSPNFDIYMNLSHISALHSPTNGSFFNQQNLKFLIEHFYGFL